MTYLVKMVRREYRNACHYPHDSYNDRKIYFEMEFDQELDENNKYKFYKKLKEQYPDLIYCSCAKILNELPKGWKKLEDTLTAPNGYYWASNSESFFQEKYESALIRERIS